MSLKRELHPTSEIVTGQTGGHELRSGYRENVRSRVSFWRTPENQFTFFPPKQPVPWVSKPSSFERIYKEQLERQGKA